jgi:Na+(H+)/acetate symporter ActP
MVIPAVASLFATRIGLADTVGLVFAVAASTFCPLLVLGIWWRRLTVTGALAGLAVGGLSATSAAVVTMVDGAPRGLVGALLAQPAAWTVPAAFLTMLVVSIRSPDATPAGVHGVMIRLHLPEGLDLDRRPPMTPIRPGAQVPGASSGVGSSPMSLQ